MRIVIRELKAHLKGTLIWCGVIVLIIVMMMSEFSAYYNNPEMADILEMMPQALMDAFALNGSNLTTLEGFVSIASLYFYILAGAFAIMLGSSLLSKEERDKTAEFFMTLPISRETILAGKTVAGLLHCLIFLAVTMGTLIIASLRYAPDATFFDFMGLTALALFLIEVLFLSIGFFVAAALKRYKKSGMVSVAIVLGTYFISMVVNISDKLDVLKYVTPFKYFESADILRNMSLDSMYLGISIAVTLVAAAGTFFIYPKRDLML